jgi:hypothetical protein
MRAICAAAMIMLLSWPAFAQDEHIQQAGEAPKDKTPAQIRSEREAKRDYERSLGNIPDKGPTDPWGAVRNNDAPKAAAKGNPAKRRIAN